MGIFWSSEIVIDINVFSQNICAIVNLIAKFDNRVHGQLCLL